MVSARPVGIEWEYGVPGNERLANVGDFLGRSATVISDLIYAVHNTWHTGEQSRQPLAVLLTSHSVVALLKRNTPADLLILHVCELSSPH